ncbi:hypothetical protein MAR_022540 [Mya arenaria]|uniref:Major facilitator superfamily associated domain-containing protein n=1 Tax=Mya arenaria TaxID=6604 RepID=A0ABY7DKF4_MYAAR|nr:hypothetical protein MAR_022540 [Mya arenaria]
MYAASSSFASEITTEGMSATVQGLVGGLSFGFGKGIGTLVTGQLFGARTGLGPVWTFRVFGFFAIAVLLLYGAVDFAFFRDATSDREIVLEVHTGKVDSAKVVVEKQLGALDGTAVDIRDRIDVYCP